MNHPAVEIENPRAEQPTTDTFRGRLQEILRDIQTETALLQRQKPRGRNVDTPEVSLLRVAHHTLAALHELVERDHESRP